MKLPFFSKASAFNADGINQTIERALSAAGLQTRSGSMLGVTETIRQALASVGLGAEHAQRPHEDSVIDVAARVIDSPAGEYRPAARAPTSAREVQPGQFVTRNFGSNAGPRAYKLYVPELTPAAPMPLIVMLHGCTQSPDDFAAGTQMNKLAEEHGFIVVYPEQPSSANMSKCWNWFSAQDQHRDRGEPSLIAGITREVMATHAVNPRRVFVAGLSAGAAMAVVMGETYPELYAGVGSHSGLPYASAHDIPSAMAAMKGSRQAGAWNNLPGGSVGASTKISHAVPTIVFHGDRDHTVKQTNGQMIVEQAWKAHSSAATEFALSMNVQKGEGVGGRAFSRTTYADEGSNVMIESWVVHGAGHAWFGGDASGTYTDRSGPDASSEMVRFFLSQRLAGSA